MASAQVMLPVIAAVALVVLAAANSFASYASDRTLDRLTGEGRERIAKADGVATALADLERPPGAAEQSGAAADVVKRRAALQLAVRRLDDLASPAGLSTAESGRLAAIRKSLVGIDPLSPDPLKLAGLRDELGAYRSAKRADIRVLRTEGERGRLIRFYRSLAAILLAFVGGGAAMFGLARARRRAESALARATRELAEAERAGRRARSFMEQVGQAATVMIYARDQDLNLAYANPAALAAVGRTWEEIAGRRGEDLAYGRESVREHEISDRQVLETGEAMTFTRVTQFAGRRRRTLPALYQVPAS